MKLQDIYAKTLQDHGWAEVGGSSKYRRFAHDDYLSDVLLGKAGSVRLTRGTIADSRPLSDRGKQAMVLGRVPVLRKSDTW